MGGWCNKDGDIFLVGDTNGDHHDDWICHHGDGTVCTKYNALIFGGKIISTFSLGLSWRLGFDGLLISNDLYHV